MAAITEVHVGPGGTFEASGDFSTTPAEVDAVFAHLRASEAKALTIHFHGGLVSEANGQRTATMMKPVYEAANNYPLSFIWETGLGETLRDNLTRIHRTSLFQKLLKWVIKRTAQRFGGFNARGAGAAIPDSEIEQELDKDRPFEDYDHEESGRGAARGGDIAVKEENLDEVRADLLAEFEEDIDADEEIERLLAERAEGPLVDSSQRGIFTSAKLAKKLATIAYRVIRRHVRDRDHGFYPTVVEEILREYYLADFGAWAWGRMKDKAESMWQANDTVSGEERHVGAYVLEHIERLQAERPGFELNLVGHSAGSIAICHLLAAREVRHSGIRINKVIFLAPAARSDLAVAQVAPLPKRFNQFRMYTMSDQFERDDDVIPKIYTRSLLYLISGALEPDEVDKPISGMMRHISRSGPYWKGAAKEWADFALAEDRTVLADSSVIEPDAPEGRRSASRKHGDFDNDVATQQSLTAALKV